MSQTPPPSAPSSARPSAGPVSNVRLANDRERDRASLKELAKFASTPSPASSSLIVPTPGAFSVPGFSTGNLSGPGLSNPAIPSGASVSNLGGDSGLVDLGAASSADPGATERAKTTPLASSGLMDDVDASTPYAAHAANAQVVMRSEAPPPQTTRSATNSAPPAAIPAALTQTQRSAVAPVPAAIVPPSFAPGAAPAIVAPAVMAVQAAPAAPVFDYSKTVAQQPKGKGLYIAAAVGALALAAGGGLFVMNSGTKTEFGKRVAPSETVALQTDEKPLAKQVAAKTQEPEAVAVAPVAEPAPPATDLDNTAPVVAAAEPAHATKGSAKHTSHASKPGAPAVAAAKEPVEAAPVVAAAPKAGKGGGSFDDAVRLAAGPGAGETKKVVKEESTGPQFAAGSVPQKPSQGQVVGAIGSVMPNARACVVAGEDSKATVTFQSTGTVQSVSVSGPAVGKPAEACIKKSLMQAKINPFMDPSYSHSVTVRP
ncbi:MAG: hypothetical protein KBF88_14420, partial [Polyangiaceae bacterium]|nr:hypothetical protein [Polyangiaceae bacterium]